MRIIKKGILPEDKEAEVRCVKCYTEFAFLRKEGEFHSDARDGDCVSIACPVCKGAVYVSIDKFKTPVANIVNLDYTPDYK